MYNKPVITIYQPNYFKDITTLTDEGFAIADKLILAEVAALDLDKQENKDKFNALMAEVTADYDDLSDSDKEILNDMYEKYLALYNEINA